MWICCLSGDILAHSFSNTFRTHKHKYQFTIKSASKYSSCLQSPKKKKKKGKCVQILHFFSTTLISEKDSAFQIKRILRNFIFSTLTRKLELHLNQNQSTVTKDTVNFVSTPVDILFANPKVKQINSCLFNYFFILVSKFISK